MRHVESGIHGDRRPELLDGQLILPAMPVQMSQRDRIMERQRVQFHRPPHVDERFVEASQRRQQVRAIRPVGLRRVRIEFQRSPEFALRPCPIVLEQG